MTNNEMNAKQNLDSAIPPFVFFGGPEISVDFLDQLEKNDTTPALIVTTPDRPSGRKMLLTSPVVKAWADDRGISVLQPENLRDIHDQLTSFDLFVVVAYGKIILQSILDIPEFGSVNLHPSLLPKYRGPSPILSALLVDDRETGISLMVLDALMDHGPIIAQKNITVDEWLPNRQMEQWFAQAGATLFLDSVSAYLLDPQNVAHQDHDLATECHKFSKSDMEIDLSNSRQSYLQYLAFDKPFFFHNNERIIVTDAEFVDGKFIINKIVPAGKKEIRWTDHQLRN